jgi:hypothetical protein
MAVSPASLWVAAVSAVLLKRGLLLFWAAWLSLVLVTNVLDGAKALGLLGGGWAFASGNYAFLCQTTARYGTPAWANAVLFAGVVAWEALAAGLSWRALWAFRGKGGTGKPALYAAWAAGLSLWAAFILADEVFITYAVAVTHWLLFVAQLATLLAVELLPEGGPGTNPDGGP